jgi:2-polyprenyl-6-methoxyphenol hydroxylase-like FAD-dependent oxidoreductase
VSERIDRVEVRFGGDAATASAVVVAAGFAGRRLAPFARPRAQSYRDQYVMADLPGPTGEPETLAIVTLDRAGVVESFPLPGGGRRLVAWNGRGIGAGENARETLRTTVAMRTGNVPLANLIEEATAFGIRRVVARRMRMGRVFVIGDAAHEISPIGGQGMNLGLLDAATLAPALAQWLVDPGSGEGIDRWERSRVRSAQIAARISGLNTALGRERSTASHLVLTGTVRAAAHGFSRVLARAYAMGFDADA